MDTDLASLEKLKNRAVSNFGSSDQIKCHLGHILLQCLADYPDYINQIDAATDQKQTNYEILQKSIRLAESMKKFGLIPGDVVAISGPNHLDLCIPFYSAMYNGLPVVGVDPTYKYEEIRSLLLLSKPKIIFCQNDKFECFKVAVKSLGLKTKIVTFHEGQYKMEDFINNYISNDDVQNFKAADFDLAQTYIWLVCTSGSTGVPKLVAHTAQVILDNMMFHMATTNKHLNGLQLVVSPVQGISYYTLTTFGTLTRTTVLKTSAPATIEHLVKIINNYKPISALFSPPIITQISRKSDCNLSCFKLMVVGGSKVDKNLLMDLRSKTKGIVLDAYGQSECIGIFYPSPGMPLGSCGKPSPRFQVKLVKPGAEKCIDGPNIPGEVYIKGPIFEGYYNNPEETAKWFTTDGWFKSGDIFYRDENEFYFFVERNKALIKYKNLQIYPSELETIIREHPDVVDVAVVGIANPDFGELPAACIKKKPGSNVTSDDMKDLVANRLSDAKQLRGGVVFVDSLPLLSSGKIARIQVQELFKNSNNE